MAKQMHHRKGIRRLIGRLHQQRALRKRPASVVKQKGLAFLQVAQPLRRDCFRRPRRSFDPLRTASVVRH